MLRLTRGKRDDLSRLLKNRSLVDGFDMLLPFPGLWKGLELGNIRNLLALHCNEALLCYLKHIYNTWDQITIGNTAIRDAVDIATVQKLHLRAPSASAVDRRYIIRDMDNGALFPAITDPAHREAIKQALLACGVIIPTIESFHDNVKYLSIGVEIIKARLLKGGLGTKGHLGITLYRAMCSAWSAPQSIQEEFREGEFRHVTLPDRNMTAHFCYMQVSEGEGNELQDEREHIFANTSSDRRSFPAPESGDADDRRTFTAADSRDTDVWNPAAIDDPYRRSLHDFQGRSRGIQDERSLFPDPHPTDDGRRSFPGMDVSSTASTDAMGCRPFPEIELPVADGLVRHHTPSVASPQRPGLVNVVLTDDHGLRPSLELHFQSPELVDGDD